MIVLLIRISASQHTGLYLRLVLSPGIFAFCLAELLLLLVVQQRLMLMKRHDLVLTGLQQLCQDFILKSEHRNIFQTANSMRDALCQSAKWYQSHWKCGHLRHNGGASSAFFGVWVVQQVGLKRVEFGQLKQGEVPLDLLLIHHSVGQRLLGHLTVIDLLLHGALEMEMTTIRNTTECL